jgi:hypothetical protein
MLLICSKVSRDQQSRPHVYVNKEGRMVINFEAERHGRNCSQVWDTVRAEDAWFPSLREVVKRFGWVQTIANGKMIAVCQCVGVGMAGGGIGFTLLFFSSTTTPSAFSSDFAFDAFTIDDFASNLPLWTPCSSPHGT